MKYCKFISQVKSSQVKSSQVKSSQVKSSQVKSSAKIVSLIALLFILLFSISCKSKQDPKLSRDDLIGTWKATYEGYEFILNIDSEGNLIFNCGLANDKFDNWHHNFAGKLADTFEYPYTIELTFTASSLSSISCYLHGYANGYYISKILELTPKSQIGKFTFHDASTLTASVIMIGTSVTAGGWVAWYDFNSGKFQTLNFTKQ